MKKEPSERENVQVREDVIIVPYGAVSRLLLGAAIAVIALALIGTTWAVFNAGGQVISYVGTPSASTDAANKAYVDAAAGGLNVYKSDNTTLLGTFVTTVYDGTGANCDQTAYINTAQRLALLDEYDCELTPTGSTWYYTQASCAGSAFITSGSTYTRNYDQWGYSSSNCPTYSYVTQRNPTTGACTSYTSTHAGCSLSPVNRACGSGKCIFR